MVITRPDPSSGVVVGIDDESNYWHLKERIKKLKKKKSIRSIWVKTHIFICIHIYIIYRYIILYHRPPFARMFRGGGLLLQSSLVIIIIRIWSIAFYTIKMSPEDVVNIIRHFDFSVFCLFAFFRKIDRFVFTIKIYNRVIYRFQVVRTLYNNYEVCTCLNILCLTVLELGHIGFCEHENVVFTERTKLLLTHTIFQLKNITTRATITEDFHKNSNSRGI